MDHLVSSVLPDLTEAVRAVDQQQQEEDGDGCEESELGTVPLVIPAEVEQSARKKLNGYYWRKLRML